MTVARKPSGSSECGLGQHPTRKDTRGPGLKTRMWEEVFEGLLPASRPKRLGSGLEKGKRIPPVGASKGPGTKTGWREQVRPPFQSKACIHKALPHACLSEGPRQGGVGACRTRRLAHGGLGKCLLLEFLPVLLLNQTTMSPEGMTG